jgi:competence protein ComEA
MMNRLLLVFALLFALCGIGNAAVNVNTASKEELDGLKGIGPVKAQAIIDYRTKNGPFKTVDELEKVPGIGPKTLTDIRKDVTISGASTPAPAKTAAPATAGKAAEPAKPAVPASAAPKVTESAKSPVAATKAPEPAKVEASKDDKKPDAKMDKKADKKEDKKSDAKKEDKKSDKKDDKKKSGKMDDGKDKK